MIELPVAGRGRKRAPSWPLPGRPNRNEQDAWSQLWRTPQAVAWERLGWTRTVGRYCRVLVAAEERGAAPALLAQVTALEDRLGLTPKSMRLLMWTIVEDEVTPRRQAKAAKTTAAKRAVPPVRAVKV